MPVMAVKSVKDMDLQGIKKVRETLTEEVFRRLSQVRAFSAVVTMDSENDLYSLERYCRAFLEARKEFKQAKKFNELACKTLGYTEDIV